MRSRHAASVLTLLALVPACALAWGDDCKFSADRAGGVDAKGVEKVVLRTGAGDLTVLGGDRNVRIEARGKACAASQELLDQTQITVRREGNVVYVETAQVMEKDGWSIGRNDYAYIDAGVALPSSIPVDAIDSSGDARYESLQSLNLQDSSGDLEVRNIAGAAVIGDSSGDLEVRNVGSLKLNDSSGDIEVDEVRGDVEVDNDSSGDIRITGVGASVNIHNDSSGGIRVEDVKGSVVVDNDSSGDIRAARVSGDFTVNGDSSGSIEHESIGGKLTIPSNKQD